MATTSRTLPMRWPTSEGTVDIELTITATVSHRVTTGAAFARLPEEEQAVLRAAFEATVTAQLERMNA